MRPAHTALLAGAAAALIAPWLVQPAIGWRDGPEFVDTSWGLGIAHPAGFPLYQALAWPFDMLPLGDIALRNHLFNAITSLLAFLLLHQAAATFLHSIHRGGEAIHSWSAAAIALVWLLMPAQMENAIQSEAYPLFACFAFLLLRLLLDHLRSGERHRYLLAAFLAGIGAGDHAMLGAFLFPLILALIPSRRNALPARLATAAAGILAGIAGLTIYLYLPVRSRNDPTIDWGDTERWSNFWHHVTDRKDSALHPSVADLAPWNAGAWLQPLHQIGDNLLGWYGPVAAILMLYGWLEAAITRPRITAVTLSWLLFLLFFFHDWPGGTVLTAPLGVLPFGLAITAWRLVRPWRNGRARAIAILLLLLAPLIHILPQTRSFFAQRSDYAAGEFTRSQLLALPYRSILLTVPDWFPARFLIDVEGLRPDLSVININAIYYPGAIEPLSPERMPRIILPRAAPPARRSASERISRFVTANIDQSPIYVDGDSATFATFGPYLDVDDADLLWNRLQRTTTHNRCSLLYRRTMRTVHHLTRERNALRDPEFAQALQYGYHNRIAMAVTHTPACLEEATSMSRWWLRHIPDPDSRWAPSLDNTLGIAALARGARAQAELLFRRAAASGLPAAIRNLKRLHRSRVQ